MNKALTFALLFSFVSCFAENSILAIVNSEIITYNSIKEKLVLAESKQEELLIINNRIDIVLQLQKSIDLELYPNQIAINETLIHLANTNDISLDQLLAYPEISLIRKEVIEKISILNLQRYITKNLNLKLSIDELLQKCPTTDNDKKIKQIKIAQIIIYKTSNNDAVIKVFLKKLSKHIVKGASFEAFARLHSQHPSYVNGGISKWIIVDSPNTKMLDLLKDGEVSEVYPTKMGFAIAIKINERHISKNLEKCKENLTYLDAEKFYSSWVKELREKAYIKIFHDALY